MSDTGKYYYGARFVTDAGTNTEYVMGDGTLSDGSGLNTTIGTDTDLTASGSTVVSNISITDGVIVSHSTRTLTLAELGYVDHDGLYLPLGGGTITGNLQVNGQITQAGVIDRVSWGRSYTVSLTNIATLVTNNGSALEDGGGYRMTGHIAGTGTNQVAVAIFWNEDGTWYCNNTFTGATSSNHVHFLVLDGVPKVKTWHASNYTVEVSHERLSLNEGSGTDNLRGYFGADSFLQWTESNNSLVVPGTLAVTGGNSTQWNTAFGWGDHSLAGYTGDQDLSGYLLNTTDTLTGNLTIANSNFTGLSITRDTANGSSIDFNNSVGLLGRVGFLSDGTLAISNGAAGTANMLLVTSAGNVSASNLNGTNTGDQDLSGYLLNTSDTFTGTITGNTMHLGGSPIQSSSAVLQVNGFIRSGNIYIHEGGNAPTSPSLPLSNNSGNLNWNSNTIWHAGNDGSGSGLDADKLDGQEGTYYLDYNNFTNVPNSLLDTTDTFTGALTVDGDIRGTGQQLIFNAGEAYAYATGQTGENVYINAEQGLEVNSETNNWQGNGWADRKTALLRGDLLSLDGESITKTNIQNFKAAYLWGDHELSAQDKTDIGNLSGINTGDQDLSGYLINTTDTMTGNLTVNNAIFTDKLYLGDAGNGYFYTDDTNDRTNFKDGKFIFEPTVPAFYLYAAVNYIGWLDENVHNFRGTLKALGNEWEIDYDGNIYGKTVSISGGTSSQYLMADGSVTTGGGGNQIIGTDTDYTSSGASVLQSMSITDGVIISHSNRTLTLADLGYTADGEGVATINPSAVDGKEGIEVLNGSTATATIGLDLDLIDSDIVNLTHVIGVDNVGKNIKTVKSQFFAYSEQVKHNINGNGSTTTFAAWHDLGFDVHVQVFDWNASSPYYKEIVYPKVEHTSASNVQVTFNTAPATGQNYRVLMNKINDRNV